MGYPPPPSRTGMGYPIQDWIRYNQKGHGTSESIMGWRYYGIHMGFTPCGQIHVPPPSEKSPRMGIFTLRRHSYFTWSFLPLMDILTSHGHFHLMWTFSPHVGIFTLHGHSHLMWTFSPHMHTRSLSKVKWGVPSII